MKNQKTHNKKNYLMRDIIIKPRVSSWTTKFFIPNFFIGHPNLRDNLRTLRKHPHFKPFRMALTAWLIFTLTTGSLGIYSFMNAPNARASDSWYNSSWGYRKKITFDNSAQAENLLNFPVLVKLSSSNIDYTKTQDLGQDIRFTDSDGTTLLKYEIEKWDETGSSFVWVKVPQIDASSSTDYIYIYYGNVGASDVQDATNVWDSSFLGVWHMKETSGTNIADSTGNHKDGTKTGANNPAPITGTIDGAQSFGGSDRVGTTINNALTDFSVEVWFKDNGVSDSGGYERLADKSYTGCFWFGRNSTSANSWGGGVLETSDPYGVFVTLTDGVWHQISSVRSGTTHYVYGDGGSVSNHNTVSATACDTTNFAIGAYGDSGQSQQRFGGIIDEVRLSNIARSAPWLAASYKSGKDTFNTFGTEEVPDHPPNTPTNSSPSNLATRQSITPTLTSSAFSDPDVGDTQTAAEWQITTTSGNYTSPIYDSGTDTTNKTSITIPGSTLNYGITYYWHVRHEDNKNAGNLSWSSYSTETSFTTVARPATPTNSSPANGAINQDTFLTLSASAFSDSDPGSSQSAAQWQVRTTSDATYSSPAFDSGIDTSNLISIAVTAGSLAKDTVYYWHVRYRDDLGNWSAYSAETVFTTGTTPITVVSIGATEYQSGETTNLTVQIQKADGTPLNSATTTITIYKPDNSVVVNSASMTYLPSSSGLYYYSYLIPATEGVYTYQVTATYQSNTSYSSHAFHVSPALNTISTINTNLNTVNTNLNTANTNLNTANTNLNSLANNLDVLIGAFIVTQSTVNDLSASATSFITALTNSTNDFYKNAVLTFTAGTLNGQVRRISAYNGSTKAITLDPSLTSAPGNGDAFTITKQNVRVEEQAAAIKTTGEDTNTKVTDIQTKTNDIQTKVTDIQTKTNSIYSLLQTVDTNLSATQSAVNNLRASQQKMYTLNLSDISEVASNSNYRSTLMVRDYEGNPIDLAEAPTITIYNSTRAEALTETAMSKVIGATGVYEYVFPISSGALAGLWEALVNVDTGGTANNFLNDYFQVTGSPTQVLVNSITANSLNNILANVTITNEGTSEYEYHYEYCIVASSDNACGGDDDVFYGSGSKKIGAGVAYNTVLPVPPGNPMSVSVAGTYYFKLVVYYGVEASGASQQFTVGSGTNNPPISGGGDNSQITTLNTVSSEINTLRQEIQTQSTQLSKTLALLGNVDPNAPGFKSLLDINLSNTKDLKEVQNKISDLKAVSSVAQKIIEQNGSAPIVETYMKFNSVEIHFLITNPLKKSQTVQFKAFLPEEARPENIMDSSGLKVEYDPNAKTYFVSGDISLGPKQTIIKKVEMKDIWVFDETELNLIKQQASDIVKTLSGTELESQGIILKGDIETTINMVLSKQKDSYSSPQDHIVAYRENKDRVAKVQSEFNQLKNLITQNDSSKNIVGNIGGIQTFATWGIILAIVFGFALLAAVIFAMWRHQTMLTTRIIGMNRRDFEPLEKEENGGTKRKI
jgi:hypothetical protein